LLYDEKNEKNNNILLYDEKNVVVRSLQRNILYGYGLLYGADDFELSWT
jgi:hypothetical protein